MESVKVSRKVTSKDVRFLATGYWEHYFANRIHPKTRKLFVVAAALLLAAAVATITAPPTRIVLPVTIANVEQGTVEVFGSADGDIRIYQSGLEVPTLVRADSPLVNNTIESIHGALGGIFLLGATGAFLAGFLLYFVDKATCVDWCVDEWDSSEQSLLPTTLSIEDYLGRRRTGAT